MRTVKRMSVKFGSIAVLREDTKQIVKWILDGSMAFKHGFNPLLFEDGLAEPGYSKIMKPARNRQ